MHWSLTLTPPEWRAAEQLKLDELHRTGQPIVYEKEYIRKDGARVPIELLVHLVRNAAGQPEYYYTFLTDITARKAAELELRTARAAALNLMEDAVTARQQAEAANAALQASEQRVQQALNVSHSFTFDWNPVTDRVLRSESSATVLGLSGAAVGTDTGRNFFQSIHTDDRARFTQILKDLTPAAASYTTEYRVVRGDGKVAVLEETGHATFDAAGKMARLVGVSTDITARKQAEEAVQQSQRTLAELIDRSPFGTYIVDSQFCIAMMNASSRGVRR